jgi:hypothetical protein
MAARNPQGILMSGETRKRLTQPAIVAGIDIVSQEGIVIRGMYLRGAHRAGRRTRRGYPVLM